MQSAGNCRFGTTWIVSGDWDGKGGDGIGFVRPFLDSDGKVFFEWHLRNSNSAGADDVVVTF